MTLPGRSRREGQHEEGQEGKTLPHEPRLARRTVRADVVIGVIAIDDGHQRKHMDEAARNALLNAIFSVLRLAYTLETLAPSPCVKIEVRRHVPSPRTLWLPW